MPKNLVNRGIVLDYVVCLFCNIEEDADHIFKCDFSAKIRTWFQSWSGLITSIPGNMMELLRLRLVTENQFLFFVCSFFWKI